MISSFRLRSMSKNVEFPICGDVHHHDFILISTVAVYLLRNKRNRLRYICKYFRVFVDIWITGNGKANDN